MPSQHIIDIIIKAEDMASQQAKKVEDSIKKIGSTSRPSLNTASNMAQKYEKNLQNTTGKLRSLKVDLANVGAKGSEAFNSLSKSQQDAMTKFKMLDKDTQNLLLNMDKLGHSGISGMVGAIDDARVKFANMDQVTKTWSGSLEYAKTKMSLMGNETSTLRGKIQTTGMAIQTYLGTKWDTIKGKVSGLGNFIKTNLSNALQSVRSKLDSLGSAFTGLGGVISTVIGGLGMNSFKDMTIGLALNREKVQSLTYAVYGTGQATDDLWDKMDTLTTQGVNNLDGLAQAMNTIKMSTGASTEELNYMTNVVNDIGQRAIMMGRSGDEAIGLMQAAGKGLNGEFAMLQDNFGITKDKLTDLGWSGAADDVKGYTDALQKYLDKGGSMDGLLQTTSGKLETFQKHVRIAGRSIGDKFTPYLDRALDKLNELSEPTEDGSMSLAQYAIAALGVGSAFATIAPSITPTLQAIDMLSGKTKSALQFFGLMEAAEGSLTLQQSMLSVAQLFGAEAATVEAAANAGLTASFWAMASAILANPLTWFAVALGAVAVAAYEVGKSFGWWSDVGSMIEAVQAGLQRLWNAFINNPNVRGFLQDLTNAWNDVCNALAPVIDWAGKVWNELFPPNASGEVDIVRMIIDAFGAVGDIMGKIVNGAKSAWSALNQFSGVAAVILGPAAIIYGALRSIVCILLGCSPGIVPALQKVQEVFLSVWSWISSFIGGIISNVVAGIQPVLDILSDIGNFLLTSFQYAWQTIVSVFGIIFNHVNLIITVFNQFLSGQISLSSALTMIWTAISSMFFSVLGTIISSAVSFAQNLVQKGLTAGKGFVNGVISFIKTLPVKVKLHMITVLNYILTVGSKWVSSAKTKAKNVVTGVINYIKNLPGRVFSILLQVASRITSAGSTWANNAKTAANKIVNGVKNNITSLPGIVANEFSQIGSRMMSAGSALYNKAANIGRGIVKSLKNAMGIHSPGIIQKAVVGEFEDTISRIESLNHSAGNAAGRLGSTIVEGFDDTSITEQNYPYAPSIKLEKGNDTVNLNATFTFTHEFNNLPETISAEEVASMINMAPYSKEFVKSLTQNEAFQAADLKVKNKISARNRRARGA